MQITNITKLIPLGGVFIILCSSIKLIIYYGMFNIKIIHYLTIKEYASLFMEDIIVYLFIISWGFIYHLFSNKWFLKSGGKWPMIFGITCGIIVNLMFLLTSDTVHERIKDFSYITYLGVFLIFYIRQLKNTKLSPTLYLMITAIVFAISSGFSSGYAIFERENMVDYQLKFTDYSIQTSENYRYLGRTEMYSFFYHLEKKESRIVNNQNLLEINIIKKKNDCQIITKDNNGYQ